MKLCERCKKKPVEQCHYKLSETKPLPLGVNHKLYAQEHPELFEFLCTTCHAEVHGTNPRVSELKTPVVFRERAINIKNRITNQYKGFGRVEYIVPDEWEQSLQYWNDTIKKYEQQVKKLLDSGDYPIWDGWLKNIKGISYSLGAPLVAFIDISLSPHASNLNTFVGLHPPIHKDKLTKQDMMKQGKGIVKKTLLGNIADSFIKQKTEPYEPIFRSSKAKEIELEKRFGTNKKVGNKTTVKNKTRTSKEGKDVNAHANRRARRKMMTVFVQHYWVIDRQLHRLPTTPLYAIDKLKHQTYIEPPNIPDILQPFNSVREF